MAGFGCKQHDSARDGRRPENDEAADYHLCRATDVHAAGEHQKADQGNGGDRHARREAAEQRALEPFQGGCQGS